MKKWCILFSALLVSLTLINATCWGNMAWVTVAEEDASGTLFSEIRVDDQLVYQWDYRLANIKTANDTATVPFMFPSDLITLAEIETFLAQRNMTAAQLDEYLGKYQTSLREFIDQADSYGTDTALFVELLDGVNKAAGEQGVTDLFSFLRDTDTSMADFVETMDQVYGEQIEYLERMEDYYENFDQWYRDYLESEAKSFAEWLGASEASNAKIGPQAAGAIIGGILSVVGLVYDIIKSTNAVNVSEATSRILHKDDPHTMSYGNAKTNTTSTVQWVVKNFAGVQCFDIQFHGGAAYDGRHQTIAGHWLPRINVMVDKVAATWPWSVDAKVALLKNTIVNRGTVANPDPECKMIAQFNAKAQFVFVKVFDYRKCSFTVRGSTGITQDKFWK